MANANVTRLGQVNQADDALALFLKVFTGEVLTAYTQAQMFMDKHRVRTISNGKSASFPTSGYIGAEYHAPGAELLGLGMNHGEVVINIDGLLVSHAFIDNLDEAMNHYEVRSTYSKQMGSKLANAGDKNVACEIIKAARSAGNLNDTLGGTEIKSDKFIIGGVGSSATVLEKAQALTAGLFQAAQVLREKNIPESETVWALFRPAEFFCLAQNPDVINKQFGGSGSIAEGNVIKVAGLNIGMSNNIPKYNGTKATYDPAAGTAYIANPDYSLYHGIDASKTVGLVFTSDAVATVKLKDLSMRVDYDARRLGNLMVATYAMGHGKLRPECAVELKLDSLFNTASTYPA
jgi:hypothetical protein